MKNGKTLDVKKFLDESLGAKEGHYGYEDIQTYARSTKRDDGRFDAIRDHLSTCQVCKRTFDDIVRCDPFLSQGRPIPKGFWQRIWRKVS
jgi:hypothetical protein